jgi:hypothetical protein
MTSFVALAQSLGLAYASGVSLYATILLVGLMDRAHWIAPLTGPWAIASHPVVLVIAGLLAVFELGASLVPGIATIWETIHTAIRPPAAAVIAVATAWHADPAIIAAAAILGGGVGLATHATKLGLRVAVDTSPEPFSNGLLSATELGIVAGVSYFIWNHPIITLMTAMVILLLTILLVRLVWRTIKRLLRGEWRVSPKPTVSTSPTS